VRSHNRCTGCCRIHKLREPLLGRRNGRSCNLWPHWGYRIRRSRCLPCHGGTMQGQCSGKPDLGYMGGIEGSENSMAVSPNGQVFTVETIIAGSGPSYESQSLVGLDPNTGAATKWPIYSGRFVFMPAGPISIGPDGSVYLQVQTPPNSGDVPLGTQLLTLSPRGNVSLTPTGDRRCYARSRLSFVRHRSALRPPASLIAPERRLTILCGRQKWKEKSRDRL
jgi:hypothetical protein